MSKPSAPNEEMKEVADYDPEFYKAYGCFMIAWADAESELYRVLNAYAEVSDAVARAIFSGTRARGMIEYIRGIAHNTKMAADRRTDLEHVFPQMIAINTMRDNLAHHATDSYGFDPAKPTMRVFTNSDRVSRYGNERLDLVSIEMLEAMTQDLYAIHNHLNMHWGRSRTGSFRPWRENDQNDPPTPWLYKPPQPEIARRKSPSTPRKHGAPRKPSRTRF